MRYVLIAMLAVSSMCGLGACITTTSPDGTVTQQLDIAAAQLALSAAQYAWEQYQAAHPADVDSDEAATLQARVEALAQVLDGLVALRIEARESAMEPGEPGID